MNAEQRDAELIAEKQALRTGVRARRRARPQAQRELVAEAVAQQLRRLVEELDARTVACFLSTELEPSTRPFLAWARDAGVRVILPVAREDGLLDWIVDTGEERMHPRLRIPEPVGEPLSPMELDEVDLVVLPAALAGRDGSRLGWGGGYYDRMLGSMTDPPPAYVLVHQDELLEQVPTQPHDMYVDGVVTEEQTIKSTRKN